MIDTPHIIETDSQRTAVIRLTIPRAEIRQVMGPAITEVMAAVAAQGIAPAGPLFSHHFRRDPDTFDFEVGVPVTEPVAATGRVVPGQLPAATVARTVYRGSYEGLGDAWGQFDDWIAAGGHRPAPNFWECYLTGPESSPPRAELSEHPLRSQPSLRAEARTKLRRSPDPATWQTELNRPLID